MSDARHSIAYITGDLHGGAEHDMRLAARRWPEGKALVRSDYVIICGDFGYVWDGGAADEYWLDWFAEKPWTTLFVDGNHENHRLLATYPVERWHGGLTHVVRANVRHLMRGQVFDDIAGSRILAMGGAASHDVEWREEGVSWWPEEMPSEADRAECRANLDACGWSVDYVVTHEATSRLAEWLCEERARDYDFIDGGDEQQRFLGELRRRLSFKRSGTSATTTTTKTSLTRRATSLSCTAESSRSATASPRLRRKEIDYGHLLHGRHALRPRQGARLLRAPVGRRGAHERGAGRAHQRARGLLRRPLRPRRLLLPHQHRQGAGGP